MDLASGVRVNVRQPVPPRVSAQQPTPARGVVVPVRGPAGPSGAAGGAWSFHQSSPAATWTLTHNLGIYPVPVVLLDDNPDRPVWTDVDYTDANSFTLTFPTPVTGWVHIN